MDQEARVPSWEHDALWYKDAIIYELHVKAFYDSTNDGTGDFDGLTQKLDYLQDLGINTLWLLPFYPSPLRDDGYDISDYRHVHPDYGTLRGFRTFLREAHRRGLKVITELVINHTSDQHPWFQAARKAPPGSVKRNYYVWSQTAKKYAGTRIIFTDTETSNWAWDPVANAYYWHRFFSHQPDLNFDNPHVVKAVIRVMRFWFDMGVDGMRLDAIPYLIEREGTNNENLPETHALIKHIRAELDARYPNRMFLAEANQWPEDVREYFGDGDECHVAYHFPLMPRMYMAVAQEDRHPIVEIMRQTLDIPETCQWAIFLRNHDELTLEMVTDRERDYMYQTYAMDLRMRLNLGIRRRLAPLMDNDMDKIKLMNSLLMSMPGSPIIYYGDEIGMGDNVFLGDRNGVRTPMQWSPDRNAGFSKADPQRLYLPPIMDPVYGYQAVNVEAQAREPSSLLNWMKRLIAVRKAHQAFGRGTLAFLSPGNRKVLAYLREFGDESILCVVNLSRSAQPVELNLGRFKGRVPVEMAGRTAFPPVGELPFLLTLPGYGFYWFLLAAEATVPAWHQELLPPAELPVLVLFEDWKSFFPERYGRMRKSMAERLRTQLEKEVLPAFLPTQRWFGAKGMAIRSAEIQACAEWATDTGSWLLTWVRVNLPEAPPQGYFLPLSLVWGEDESIRSVLPCSLAKVRQRAQVGVLYDAFVDEAFGRALVRAMGRGDEMAFDHGRLKFSATSAYRGLVGEDPGQLSVRRSTVEGTNSALSLGDRLFLKGYRRLQLGVSAELEMGRFLTDVSPFRHIAPVAGALEYHAEDASSMTLALLQGYVENQGDAWSYTLNYLERFLEGRVIQPPAVAVEEESIHASYLLMMRTLGRRTGELHQALAVTTGDPAFDPEPVRPEDLSVWTERVRTDGLRALGSLERRLADLPEAVRQDAARVLGLRAEVLDRIATAVPPAGIEALKTRYHGDYHLGQVLVFENDFIIIDFEGEPARPLEQRRLKHSPFRDVAGMLRSFNYAAYATLFRVTAERLADFALLEPAARSWERLASQAFLEGYHEVVQGPPVYPADSDHARGLLDLFVLEKALYELGYELANRPDWLRIPLKGILTLLGQEQPALQQPGTLEEPLPHEPAPP
jgi:maltose alpha-D-glucosyltransferase/alpha-amylase